jgi:uncharacterized protein
MQRWFFKLIWTFAFIGIFILGVGELLTRPASRIVGPPPPELKAEIVEITTKSRLPIVGWFAKGVSGQGAVLLLHGVRGDRRDMLGRALSLRSSGYSVLLVDLPSHGESGGSRITFGLSEAEGVTAALKYMHQRLHGEKIGVIGVSMGAAALVYASETSPLAAVVLESMYPTITEAVEDRIEARIGHIGRAFAPALLIQLPIRLGINKDDLRPIDSLPFLQAPVLIVSGDQDKHTKLTETQRLYGAAREPKELWIVRGAGHVNLHSYDRKSYEIRVYSFLARHLRGAT